MIAPNTPMRRAGLVAKPSMLPASWAWCPRHATGGPKGWKCGACKANPTDAPRVAPSKPPRSTAGHDAEDALARQFAIEGWIDTTEREPFDSLNVPYFRRQHHWGLALTPRRGFAADFAFLAQRLLVEVTGGAHAAGRAKWKSDTERTGLAASLGWTVLPVTPEEVRDGTALERVKAALAAKGA